MCGESWLAFMSHGKNDPELASDTSDVDPTTECLQR